MPRVTRLKGVTRVISTNTDWVDPTHSEAKVTWVTPDKPLLLDR